MAEQRVTLLLFVAFLSVAHGEEDGMTDNPIMSIDDHYLGVTTYLGAGRRNRTTVHLPLPADHPFCNAVGRVASEWSHLEHSLDRMIWSLAGPSHNHLACITALIMGVGRRCKAIIALGIVEGASDHDLKPFRRLINDSYTVADKRARWIHDPWYIDQDSEIPGQYKSMPNADHRFGIHDVDAEELSKTIGLIKDLQRQASEAYSFLHHALRDKRPPERP